MRIVKLSYRDPKEKFLIEAGLGFFVEVNGDEAKPIINKRREFLSKKVTGMADEIAKVRMNVAKVI